MKKNMKVLVSALLVVMLCLSLAACGDKGGVVGSWEAAQDGTTVVYTFNEDMTGKMEVAGMSAELTYTIDGDILEYTMKIMEEEEKEKVKFRREGDKLIMASTEEGATEEVTFTKKK